MRKGEASTYAALPVAMVATLLVIGVPVALSTWLRAAGAVESVWVSAAIGVAASFALSQVGAALWRRFSRSNLLFSELMIWGWVQRWRCERRVADATDLLGLHGDGPAQIDDGHLTVEQTRRLLTQLTADLEGRDPYTHGHSRRVARYGAAIAKALGLPGEEVARIRAAGAMHDVGKVDTPAAILQKAGPLTDDEYAIVQRHPVDGAAMVAVLDDAELTAIVRHHHERMDGTGYPDGLAGDAIPLGARILAVADTFDAITSTRPYRRANPHRKALGVLAAEAGTQLDPDAVRAFQRAYTGSRALAFWSLLANLRPRVAATLGDVLSPAGASNVVATAATAAAVGAVALGPTAAATPEPSPAATPTAAAAAPAAAPTAGAPRAEGLMVASMKLVPERPAGRRAWAPGKARIAAEAPRAPRSIRTPSASPPAAAPAPAAPAPAAETPAGPVADPAPVRVERPKRKRRKRQGPHGHSKGRDAQPVLGHGPERGRGRPRPQAKRRPKPKAQPRPRPQAQAPRRPAGNGKQGRGQGTPERPRQDSGNGRGQAGNGRDGSEPAPGRGGRGRGGR